jgi:hypothetical protein
MTHAKCPHGRRKYYCVECGGTGLCEHKRRRATCIECGGASICEHKRQRVRCVECGGASICEHKRQRAACIECGGADICEHKRQRASCIECGGARICEHKRHRHLCKICTDPIKVTIKGMIGGSKQSDKKCNRYDEENFIDEPFITRLISEYSHCYYADCRVKLQYTDYQHDMATIERIDNTIGHVKSNCVLCCRTCNFARKSNK